MPVNYNDYPPNWKTEIRPRILERAKNCCEICSVPNHKLILRGTYNGIEVYQDDDGTIFDANTSEALWSDYVGEVHPTNNFVKVVLTIAHLEHDITKNEDKDLKALCQRCHNRLDVPFRKANRIKNKGQLQLV